MYSDTFNVELMLTIGPDKTEKVKPRGTTSLPHWFLKSML